MAYHVRLRPSAEKDLAKIPVNFQIRIRTALEELAVNPYFGKKLGGEYVGLYSVRVWPYRIIYSIHKQELLIIVIRIAHRQGVY